MASVKNSPVLELEKNNDFGLKIAKVIAFFLVLIGMLNTIPAIPGLEELVWRVTGNDRIVFRKFSYEYFFPLTFFIMMVVVSLNHSFWREYKHTTAIKRFFLLNIVIFVLFNVAYIT